MAGLRALVPKDTQSIKNLDQTLVKGNKEVSSSQDLESLRIYKNSSGSFYIPIETMQTPGMPQTHKKGF